jgi:hypothetical protein
MVCPLGLERTPLTLLEDKSNPIIPNRDSTLCGVYGIDSTYMKKAALYARVNGDLQAKEGTIESQAFLYICRATQASPLDLYMAHPEAL